MCQQQQKMRMRKVGRIKVFRAGLGKFRQDILRTPKNCLLPGL